MNTTYLNNENEKIIITGNGQFSFKHGDLHQSQIWVTFLDGTKTDFWSGCKDRKNITNWAIQKTIHGHNNNIKSIHIQ